MWWYIALYNLSTLYRWENHTQKKNSRGPPAASRRRAGNHHYRYEQNAPERVTSSESTLRYRKYSLRQPLEEGLDDPVKKDTVDRGIIPATVRIDTPVEMDYYRNGGILQTVLRKLLKT